MGKEIWRQFGGVAYEFGSTELPDGVSIKDIAHALSQQVRFAGHCDERYSVARHSLVVSKLLDASTKDALYGLIHDVAETVTGDIPGPMKATMSAEVRKWYKGIEDAANRALFARLGVPYPIPKDIAERVKRADEIALATEIRDVMPLCDRERNLPEEPWHNEVVSGTVKEDTADWLARYNELMLQLDWEIPQGIEYSTYFKAEAAGEKAGSQKTLADIHKWYFPQYPYINRDEMYGGRRH